MALSPNVAGQAYALTVLTPIRAGQEPSLRAFLEGLDRPGGRPLARLPRTHFGRWVIVPDLVNEPDQPREDHLPSPCLLFSACFDGPLGSYLDELGEHLAPEAEEIWGRCVGAPEPARGAALARYLRAHQVRTGLFVAAYGHATVGRVRASLERRERLRAFALRAQALEPVAVRDAFRRELGPR